MLKKLQSHATQYALELYIRIIRNGLQLTKTIDHKHGKLSKYEPKGICSIQQGFFITRKVLLVKP